MDIETLFINTDVSIADIYNKAIKPHGNLCQINDALLWNAIYLTAEKMVYQWLGTKRGGYVGRRVIRHKGTRYRKTKTKATRYITRKINSRKMRRKTIRGGEAPWVKKLIRSVCFTILILFMYGVKKGISIHPEYDTDVMNRLVRASEVRELFDNRHGTCVANTALFLGSINMQTYSEITEKIIENKRGLTFSETSHYLNYAGC